jgi:hypothetical protein
MPDVLCSSGSNILTHEAARGKPSFGGLANLGPPGRRYRGTLPTLSVPCAPAQGGLRMGTAADATILTSDTQMLSASATASSQRRLLDQSSREYNTNEVLYLVNALGVLPSMCRRTQPQKR